MGFLQDRGPQQDREGIWDHAFNERDYSGGHHGDKTQINCDYVMGRMMKLYFTLQGNKIEHGDNSPRRDYQAWCGKYPSYSALFDAAEKILP